MSFREGEIEGVIIKELKKNVDARGWLAELFRQDGIEEKIYPVMAYVSETLPGVTRGPHEHQEQVDYFCFISSEFKLFLWDNRKDSKTYMNKMVISAGEKKLRVIIIPHGVVHAYKNVGKKPGLVLNLPNRLYAGWGRKEMVDEIRYENDPKTIFKVEEQ